MTKTTSKGKAARKIDDTSYVNDAVDVPVEIPHEGATADPKAIAAATAQKLTRPEVSAASIISSWQKNTHDVNAVVDALGEQVLAVNGGDLARAEGLLIAQAHALDSIFTNLARRATTQEFLKQWEAYMRMAMKAQNQCRMTLETLAAVKNPPMVFAKQANINNGGQQQVNNGMPNASGGGQRAHAGAANSSSTQTELLGASNGQWLDAGAAATTGGADSVLETVGAIHGPENR